MVAKVTRRLHRSARNRILLGVAGGLGEYFGLDPVLFRVAFVLTAPIGGLGVLAYLVLALILPVETADCADDCRDALAETTGGLWLGALAGLALVGLGLLFLVGELGWLAYIPWGLVWSLVLVSLGAFIFLRRK